MSGPDDLVRRGDLIVLGDLFEAAGYDAFANRLRQIARELPSAPQPALDRDALAVLPEVQAMIAEAVDAQQQQLLAWGDARQADVMGCLELTAQEEAIAIGWIDNFRAAIRKRGEGEE